MGQRSPLGTPRCKLTRFMCTVEALSRLKELEDALWVEMILRKNLESHINGSLADGRSMEASRTMVSRV
jgi:hypothetical protein